MIVTFPKVLLEKLGNEGAEALAQVLNETESIVKSDLATKGDLIVLKSELKEEVLATRKDMEAIKSELIKWMFIFWVGQLGATLGILFVFFKR